ncbi:MAG: hypothetical protein ABI847_07435, partial [Anaerolineales bacterium]
MAQRYVSLPPQLALDPQPPVQDDPAQPALRPLGRLRARVAGLAQHSLRARVALGIGLPLLLALSGLSVAHYWRERDLLQEQARLTALQFGQLVIGSLRQSMLD